MDAGTVAIGEVVLLPLIVGLIQLIKRFAPEAPGNLWLALAFLFGVIGQFVVFLIGHGGSFAALSEWTLEVWALAVVTGLAFGLAAGKSFDELAARGLLARE